MVARRETMVARTMGQWYTRRGTTVRYKRDNGTLGERQWYTRGGTMVH